MFKMFNKSSKNMPEIKSESIDLIITGPPYNIGTKYDIYEDNLSHKDFLNLMERIFSECHRVLKRKGRLVIEVADTIYVGGVYIQLAGLIQKICLSKGFHLESRHINFVNTSDKIEIPEHDWNSDHTTLSNAHSNCHQYLVMTKLKNNVEDGEIFYSNYKSSKVHPCPFPYKTIKFILSKYFKKGMKVLDPFMGTGNLGEVIIKNDGDFYGYEIVKKYFMTALTRLDKL